MQLVTIDEIENHFEWHFFVLTDIVSNEFYYWKSAVLWLTSTTQSKHTYTHVICQNTMKYGIKWIKRIFVSFRRGTFTLTKTLLCKTWTILSIKFTIVAVIRWVNFSNFSNRESKSDELCFSSMVERIGGCP